MSGEIEVQQISIRGQSLRVAIKHGSDKQPPLLLFNGIGANWELAKPLLEASKSTTAIIFDAPGVGGSPRPLLPYRPSTIARLAAGLVTKLGYAEIGVAGVSWGPSRSNSRINILNFAGGWCSRRRPRVSPWCQQAFR